MILLNHGDVLSSSVVEKENFWGQTKVVTYMIVHERPRNLGWQNVCKELLTKTIIIAPSSSPMIEFNILYYIVCLFLCPLLPLHLKIYGIVMTTMVVEHGYVLGYHITLCYWSPMDRQQMAVSNARW